MGATGKYVVSIRLEPIEMSSGISKELFLFLFKPEPIKPEGGTLPTKD
jgi:hypothetical protein